jgi:hypothetical protein
MVCKPNAFVLTGSVTICAEDRVLLTRIRKLAYPDADSHETTAGAVANSLGGEPVAGSIVGFGVPGLIFTGAGVSQRRDPTCYMSSANESIWIKEVKRVIPTSTQSLTLCSCNTGADQAGADFLLRVARALGIRVLAPTGFVFLDAKCTPATLYLEEGATWQEALPEARQPPVAKPQLKRTRPLESEPIPFDRRVPFDLSAVKSVQIFREPDRRYPTWTDDHARTAVSYVFFESPYQADPDVIAETTGLLAITAASAGSETLFEFRILGDRLLQDIAQPSIYYYVDLDGVLSHLL